MKIEDFTGSDYTEVDVPGTITVTAPRVLLTNYSNVTEAYVYKDAGAKFFKDRWAILFELYITSIDLDATWQSRFYLMALANALDTYQPLVTADESFLALYLSANAANAQIRIREIRKGNVESGTPIDLATGTQYYCTFVRDGITVTLYVYSNAARTTLVGSDSVNLQNPDFYRYFYPFMGFEGASTAQLTTANIDNVKNVESDDPKYIIKDVLDEISVKKDDEVTDATVGIMYYNAYDGLRELFTTYDAVVCILDPATEGTRFDAHQNKPVHHPENYPVVVYVKDKSVSNVRKITALELHRKIREQFRTLIEASSEVNKDDSGNPGYTLRITGSRPALGATQIRAGGQTMWQVNYDIRYADE